MSLWNKLFSKPPTEADIRAQLKEIERDQRKKRRLLEIKEQEKQEKLRQAIGAKKNGKQELVRDIFREMRQLEIDNGYINTDLRRLSLSKTALTSFLRKMELLSKKHDRKSLQNLIMRFKESGIQKKIDDAEVSDDTFNEMLEEVLGDQELELTASRIREDAGFAEFDQVLTQMAEAEESASGETDFSRFQEKLSKAIKAEKPGNE